MEKIRIGIVGLGKLGWKHAENIAYKIPNAELIAACSATTQKVEKAKKELGVKYGYTNYEEMVKNPEVDAIAIISPSKFHYEHIELALKNGKHIFCEKPLALTLEECEEIEKLVKEYPDLYFMLGFMRRFDESYAYAKQKIKEGLIGKPFMVRCYGLDPIALVDVAIPFAKTSGGLYLDMMVHDIDLARWYLESEGKTAYALGGCYVRDEFAQYNDVDNGVALIEFENGGIGMFYAGRTCAHGYHIETEIIGTKGSLRVGSTPDKNLTSLFNEHGVVKECSSSFLERFDQAYFNEVNYFINCLINKEKPSVAVSDGVLSTKIAYACQHSLDEKSIITIK
ncbi:MAG: Gfo/Idh/MocA family oxidoreductase [Marinisporobacter sp.]|jgi:myo-inositol 2-dehydrogenase/D-chiro-inositol 1-dehydrogenase|nr:Gfo/Idh/MocA family oxidoreductase [Marinisporobacter sp.]